MVAKVFRNLYSVIIAGLLTRDTRFVERKKPGQKKARKKFAWYELCPELPLLIVYKDNILYASLMHNFFCRRVKR